jgi:serine/threonine-protein kinase
MLVEGSVQRAGKRLRITASLVDVNDGSAIWSERYDREMSDVFATQSEISQSIATALAPKLGIAPADARSTSGTNSPEAYDVFLRARFAFDTRELRPAIGYFRQAIALDVKFARAYSGIAEALALLPQYGAGNYAQLRDSIQLVAGQALSLDSTLSGPHTALGLLAKGSGDWSTGEQELARAVALEPNDGTAHQNVGELLFTIGRFDDAARALSRAAQFEPASATIVGEFAFALLLTSQLDSAERTIDRALQLDGRQAYLHFTKALIAERRGRYADAIPPLVAAIDRSSLPFFVGVLARAQYQAGKVAEARTTREQVGALGNVAGTALARAIADSPTGEPSRMLDDLERAAAEHDPLMFLLPFRLWWFDRVRNDPRFAALLKSLHLPVTAGEQMPAVVK